MRGLRGFFAVAIYTKAELWIIKKSTIDTWLTAGEALIIITSTLEFIKGGLLRRIDRCLALDPAVIAPVGALIPRLLYLIIGCEFSTECLAQGFCIIICVFIGTYIENLLAARKELINNICGGMWRALLLGWIF